jgi:hypothetical protein
MRQPTKEALRRAGITRLLWPRKAGNVRRHHKRVRDNLRYVLADPELENYTYDIENREELARWLDRHVGLGAGRYAAELDQDTDLRRELARTMRWRPAVRFQPFGRRLGWYAIVRATKPRLVVETGTHDGLGSVALLAALERNTRDGYDGRLVSIDPREATGWMVPCRLRCRWTNVRHTSYDAFPSVLNGEVPDLFIHDSLHTLECETWELETAAALGTPLLLSDNSHASTVLRDLAESHGATFAFFRERPKHWYPGAGIGLARLR